MTDTYKLIYTNLRARAEPIRLIFALADVPYEDFRFDTPEEWEKIKITTPWEQVPVLEINGKQLAQSSAICRYLARKFNLTGADEFEAAKCDEIVDAMMDLRLDWKAFFFENDEDKRAALKKKLIEVAFPAYFGKFEKIAENNEEGFLVGKTVTWADLHIAHTLENYRETVDSKCLDEYPMLQKLKDAVFNIPKIKDWVDRRPETER